MSRPAALRPGSRYPECPPRSSAAGLRYYPMSRPAALRPGSYSSIIISGPDMEDWTALAQDLGIVCFVSPSFPGSPVLPASGQDQACGPAGLPSSLSLVGASMIIPSAFPAAASLGKVRWGDDSLYDNAEEKGACRGLVVLWPWNSCRNRTLRCGGRTGVRIYCRQCFAYGRLAGICGIDILGAGHFPAIVVVLGIGDCP